MIAHPFSSYCQKVIIALREFGLPYRLRMLGPDTSEEAEEFARHWPPGKFPLLLDAGVPVSESTIIIEHLQLRSAGSVRLLPETPEAALPVRALDRVFDLHVMSAVQQVVNDALRPPERRDATEVARAKAALARVLGWLEGRIGAGWAVPGSFSLADCAAAPALFYADWVDPFAARFPALHAYRARLLAGPSVAQTVDDARPFRSLFPLGAPDRD